MRRQTELTLIAESPGSRGVYDTAVPSTRTVYCTVYSIGEKEHYDMRSHEMEPGCKVLLADYTEYQGEKHCILEGTPYRIERNFINEQLAIELTLVRDDHAVV